VCPCGTIRRTPQTKAYWGPDIITHSPPTCGHKTCWTKNSGRLWMGSKGQNTWDMLLTVSCSKCYLLPMNRTCLYGSLVKTVIERQTSRFECFEGSRSPRMLDINPPLCFMIHHVRLDSSSWWIVQYVDPRFECMPFLITFRSLVKGWGRR